MELADSVHELSKRLPRDEFALKDQLRRAAISIPSNIAEGSRRPTRADYARFLHIALGSTTEMETQLLLAKRWYPKSDISTALALSAEVGKMLSVLVRRISG